MAIDSTSRDTDAPEPLAIDALPPELRRYHRQMLLPGFGVEGQRCLLASKALIVGCGALGTVIANQLARAGVGHLVIIDRDFIEITNLQRQVLFDEQDVANAIPKAEAARRKLATINSQVRVTALIDDLNHTNIEAILLGKHAAEESVEAVTPCDVVIDGVDNFETRFLVNDAAVKHGIPYVYGGAVGSVGMSYAILPHTPGGDAAWERQGKATPCLRCIFEQVPPAGMNPTCDTAGVLGPAVEVVASMQAAEAIKLLSGNLHATNPRLTHIDLWQNRQQSLGVQKAYDAGDCVCCKRRRFEYLDGAMASTTTTMCGRNAVQIMPQQGAGDGNRLRLNLDELANQLRAHGQVTGSRFMLRAEIADPSQAESPLELTVFTDGRAIVKGTKDASVARGVYAKYIGG